MYDVIALGELLIDFAAKETDADGYPTMKANPGGAPGNFLAALNKYGMKTAFLGKVGDDAFGKLLLKTFEKAGIETKGILTDPSVFTTLAFVTFSPEGDRSFSFARKPGADTRLSFEEIDLTMIDEASVFHFGTLSLTDDPVRTATKKCVEYAKEHGKLITFDPNLRLPLWKATDAAKEQILWGLAHADVVKISDEEMEFLWGITDEKEAAKKLLDEFGIRLAMITMGPKGAYLANQNGARSLTDFLWVQSSRSSPIPRRNITDPAVLKSHRSMDTVIAVASRTSTSSFLPASFLMPLITNGTDWIAVHTARTGAGRKIFVRHLVRHFVTSFSWNS